MENRVEYVIESKRKAVDWKEIWQYRELFYFFTWRDVKVKYKQTVLGLLWVVLQPVITVLIFSLFFGRALNVPSQGLPYPLFVFSGLLLWTVFSSGITGAGSSMLSHSNIIKKIYFPRIIIPISAILVSCIDFLVAFTVFFLMMIYYKTGVDVAKLFIFWPAAILLTFIGTLGIGCWLAALNVKYRDFRYIIPFGLQVALFVSPVLYPVSIVENTWINHVLAVNPMYAAITLFRLPLIGGADLDLIVISIISSVLLLLVGIYYFKKTEAVFADIV
jgi:lipopolysaccharide transport system permease protein